MKADLSDQLLADWNYYKLQTHFAHTLREKNARIRPKMMDDKTRKLLDETRAWCRSKGIEPRLWMYALFKLRSWMAAPKLTPGCLMSNNLIGRYKKMTGLGFFRRRRRATQREEREHEMFDPNRDVNHAIEGIKLQYIRANRAQECLDQMMERTLGWHPDSKSCLLCPLAGECAIKLAGLVRFDIIALRRGRITSRDAQAIVEAQQ